MFSIASTTDTASWLVIILLFLAVTVASVIAVWKVFEKAGQAGWKAIIPIYNTVTMCRIAGLSGWFVLLVFIPYIGLIPGIYLLYRVSRSFGHGAGMAILMLLVIGTFILAFGDSRYIGPNGQPKADNPAPPNPTPAPPTPPAAPVPPQPPAPASPTPAA